MPPGTGWNETSKLIKIYSLDMRIIKGFTSTSD